MWWIIPVIILLGYPLLINSSRISRSEEEREKENE